MPDESDMPPGDDGEGGLPPQEMVFSVGDPVDTSKIKMMERRDRIKRKKLSGRKIKTISDGFAGTYISSRLPLGNRDIAVDATLRAAAPYQRSRDKKGLCVAVRDEDIREKVRVGKISMSCIFVVDASGSMGAEKRMEAAKGAVFSMLADSYMNRDKVGLVAFRGEDADLLLPPCSSVDLAMKMLEEMPTGGRTPLVTGLSRGMDVLINEMRKNPDTVPMMVIVSDGRLNTRGFGKDDVIAASEEIRGHGIHTVVIDTEDTGRSFLKIQLGYCRTIADYSGGKYYPLKDLNSSELSSIASLERKSLLPN